MRCKRVEWEAGLRIRSDQPLKYLLLTLHENAASENVAHQIMQVLDHMGDQSPYRGGKQLIELLDFAMTEARADKDEQTLGGLSDALGYATGRVLYDDLNERYALYPSAIEKNLRVVEHASKAAFRMVIQEIDSFLAGNPRASVGDIRSHFERIQQSSFRFTRARRAGHFEAFRISTDMAAWMADVFADRVTLRGEVEGDPRVEALLAESDAELLVTAAQLRLRRRQVENIRRVVENRYSKEEQLRRALHGAPWLFGCGYVDEAAQRRLTMGTELDIALLRPDGVLQVVELKQANLSLVKWHRKRPIPTAVVHNAVGQVINYLCLLDEDRDQISVRHGIETRRASATIVLGHPSFQPEFNELEINEALRTYSSTLNRIDVITYKELLDNAVRSLELSEMELSARTPGRADVDTSR